MITGSSEHFNISYFARVKKCFSFRSKNGIPALLVLVWWWPSYGIFELNLNPLSSNNIHNISASDTK